MPTLLIADDHEGVLATLDYVLSQHGVRVLTANSGAAAVQRFETEKIDAALIALCMPVMDGLAVCRTLRQRGTERGQNLPVWIMTAAFTASAEKSAKEAGAVTLLKKPFDCVALVRDIKLCLEEKMPIPASPTTPPPARAAD